MFIFKEYKAPVEIIEEEFIQNSEESSIPENNLNSENQFLRVKHLAPKIIELNSNKVQKTVNYFNHKFVISDTEDISVDTLISQQPEIFNSKKRKIEPNIEIKRKVKESLLKTDFDNEKFEKFYQNKIFIIKDGQMIPVLSPIVLNSGIFRSKNNLPKKSSLNELIEIKPRDNVLYTNTIKGNILTMKNFEKQIVVKPRTTPNIISSHLEHFCDQTVESNSCETKISTNGISNQIW